MDKLKMQTVNKADENFKKPAELFPNGMTETIDEATSTEGASLDKILRTLERLFAVFRNKEYDYRKQCFNTP